jgi:hypothetical protein
VVVSVYVQTLQVWLCTYGVSVSVNKNISAELVEEITIPVR